jgi:hypothetical protein
MVCIRPEVECGFTYSLLLGPVDSDLLRKAGGSLLLLGFDPPRSSINLLEKVNNLIVLDEIVLENRPFRWVLELWWVGDIEALGDCRKSLLSLLAKRLLVLRRSGTWFSAV